MGRGHDGVLVRKEPQVVFNWRTAHVLTAWKRSLRPSRFVLVARTHVLLASHVACSVSSLKNIIVFVSNALAFLDSARSSVFPLEYYYNA